MSNTAQAQMPDWYAAETEADEVVAALELATKNFSLALVNQDVARFIREKHQERAGMCGLRLQNDLYEIAGRNQT